MSGERAPRRPAEAPALPWPDLEGLPAWPPAWGPEPRDERSARAAWTRLAEPADPLAGEMVRRLGARAALRALALRPEALPGGRFAARLAGLDVAGDLARAEAVGARLLIPGDPEWPAGLDDLPRPPIALWVRGPMSLAAATARSVAIVGARAATAYGQSAAADIAAGAGLAGFGVVSGAAFGIDACAHRSALAVGAPTVAVLAGGVDRPYPVAHTQLLAQIAQDGVVVSEAPPGAAPMKQRFLLRNRLIAALSRGTLVVEAGLRSGSRNTAGTAAELNRVVMALPGPVTSMSSAGCHEMIRSGMAVLVTDAADVIEEVGDIGADLGPVRRGPETAYDGLDPSSLQVLDALPTRLGSPLSKVAAVAGLGERDVRSALGRLELRGLAERDGPGWRRAG